MEELGENARRAAVMAEVLAGRRCLLCHTDWMICAGLPGWQTEACPRSSVLAGEHEHRLRELPGTGIGGAIITSFRGRIRRRVEGHGGATRRAGGRLAAR